MWAREQRTDRSFRSALLQQMSPHVVHGHCEHVRILLYLASNGDAAEADEEVDSGSGLEIADAIADECGLAVRPRPDVAHDKLLPSWPGQEGAVVITVEAALLIETEPHAMDRPRLNVQPPRQRQNGRVDSG